MCPIELPFEDKSNFFDLIWELFINLLVYRSQEFVFALLCALRTSRSHIEIFGQVYIVLYTFRQFLFHVSNFLLSSIPHLLMVSSSSESQKLVVSSSLLIMVLELSYPARWRSRRLWPFMRGPGQKKPQRQQLGVNMKIHVSVYFHFHRSQTFFTSQHSLIISLHIHCLEVGKVPNLDGTPPFFITAVLCWVSPCCSMLSLCRGLSLLKETTDSVSVWSSSVSTLPVALGLWKKTQTHSWN